jgi:hypothetical protein
MLYLPLSDEFLLELSIPSPCLSTYLPGAWQIAIWKNIQTKSEFTPYSLHFLIEKDDDLVFFY